VLKRAGWKSGGKYGGGAGTRLAKRSDALRKARSGVLLRSNKAGAEDVAAGIRKGLFFFFFFRRKAAGFQCDVGRVGTTEIHRRRWAGSCKNRHL